MIKKKCKECGTLIDLHAQEYCEICHGNYGWWHTCDKHEDIIFRDEVKECRVCKAEAHSVVESSDVPPVKTRKPATLTPSSRGKGKQILPWAAGLILLAAGIGYWLAQNHKDQADPVVTQIEPMPESRDSAATTAKLEVLKKENEILKTKVADDQATIASLQGDIKTKATESQAMEKFIRAYYLIVEADNLARLGQKNSAIQKYRQAQNNLAALQSGYPNWNAGVVGFRLKYVDQKLKALVEVVVQSEPEPQATAQTTTVTEQETKPGNQEAIKEVKPVEVVPQSEPKPIPAPKKPGDLVWGFKTQGDVSSSPAIGIDGIVYCASEDRKVYALDGKTGKNIWEFEASSLMKSSPAIGCDGTIYVGSLFGYLHALDGKTGAKKWEFVAGGFAYSSPAIGSDGTLYVGSDDSYLYALESKTGIIKWIFKTGDWIRSSPVIGTSGEVYFVSYNKKAYSLDKSKPFKIWEHDLPFTAIVGGSFAVAYDGTLYFGAKSKQIYALSGKTGKLKWEFETGHAVWSSPAIGPDGTVYVGSDDKKVYAINPDGTKRWEFETGDAVRSSPALGDNEVVYFGSNDNYFSALDSKTGKTKWVFKADDDISSSPVLSEDGMIYFGSDDNWIYALKTSSEGPANSSWPMYRQNPQHTGRLPSIKQIEQTNTTTSTERDM